MMDPSQVGEARSPGARDLMNTEHYSNFMKYRAQRVLMHFQEYLTRVTRPHGRGQLNPWGYNSD